MADTDTVEAFQAEQQRILDQLAVAVGLLWDRLGSWNAEDVPRFAAQVTRVAYAANLRLARLTDAYVAVLSRTEPIGISTRLEGVLRSPRGVEPEELWRRPFIQHWANLSQGQDFETSLRVARERAVTIATHDAQMAVRATMAEITEVHATEFDEIPERRPPARPEPTRERGRGVEVPETPPEVVEAPPETLEADDDFTEPEDELAKRRVIGYRRVLTGRSCVFCAAAATKVYRRGDLMPLHAHCDCGVAPIYGTGDPGKVVNRGVLLELKKRGPEYWRQRGFVDDAGRPIDPTDVPERFGRVTENPDIGPVLAATA